MTKFAELYHATQPERVDKILEEGIIPRGARKPQTRPGSETVRENAVYLFDPEDLPDYLSDEYLSRPCFRCQIEADKVYVAKWGGIAEKMRISRLESMRPTYEEYTREETHYDDETTMFLHAGEIPPGRVNIIDNESQIIQAGEV